MLRVAAEVGLDLANHRSRTVEKVGLNCSDLVMAMEPVQLKRLRVLALAQCQITLLGLWARRPRPHIEDPYGLSLDYFRTCIGLIDEAVVEVAGQLGAPAAIADDAKGGRPGPTEV
jgi:protein-tyrosine phosphatase